VSQRLCKHVVPVHLICLADSRFEFESFEKNTLSREWTGVGGLNRFVRRDPRVEREPFFVPNICSKLAECVKLSELFSIGFGLELCRY
jgi:hypothetical protein